MQLLDIEMAGGRWSLLPEGAAYWHGPGWLVVADVHFGKAATFRALGIPVPHGTTLDTLLRLGDLVDRWRPQALLVLGDLFHARQAHAPRTLAQLQHWRNRYLELDIVLVEGNHDHRAGPPPRELSIRVVADPWRIDGVAFAHHPGFIEGVDVVAGHMHPAIRIHGRGDDSLRVPCFWLRAGLMVMPAFGAFTGAATVEREPGDRVIAVADGRLFEIPALRDAA